MTDPIKKIPAWVWAVAAVVVPMLVVAALKWHSLPPDSSEMFGSRDGDPWLRLTLVRDWLSGGSWYSHAVTHTNAPMGGIVSPWTRPLDVVIAGLASLQPDSVEVNLRLMRAALLLPALWMGLLLLGLMRVTRVLCPLPAAAFAVTIVVVSCPLIWNYYGSANADHHAPMTALFVWIMVGIITPTPSTKLSLITGVLMGLHLWISPEALTLIAIIYGWYGMNWLSGDDSQNRHWRKVSYGLMLSTAAALIVERPVSDWWVPIYDTLSIVYVFVTFLVGVAVLLLTACSPRTFTARLCLAGVVLLAALGGAYAVYPKLFQGPLVEAAPFIHSQFLANIQEVKSPLGSPTIFIFGALIQGAFALLILFFTPRGMGRIFTQKTPLMLAYFILCNGVLYLLQKRFHYYYFPLLVPVLATFLTQCFEHEDPRTHGFWPAQFLNRLRQHAQAGCRIGTLLVLVALPLGLLVASVEFEPKKDEARIACYANTIRMMQRGVLTTALGNTPLTLLANTDVSAHLLFFTPYKIVASNYHREGPGIAYVWGAETLKTLPALRAHLAERGINTIVVCPPMHPQSSTLWQALYEGKTTAPWLTRVAYNLPVANSPDDKKASTAMPVLLRVTPK